MKRRAMLAGLIALSGCGGGEKKPPPPPPPPPTTLSLQLTAAPDVNPDGTGTPGPLRVRVLQLADTNALAQADFFTLDADPAKVLGPALLGSADVVLRPGQTVTLTPEVKPETKFIGVVAAYYAIDKAKWRAWLPVKPHVANAMGARFGADSVTLTERAG
jgi:type VI secretion system protein VasD